MIHLKRSCALGAIVVASACASTETGGEPEPRKLPDDCGVSCSADGHAVVDCHGAVVTACDGYASCFDGKCIPACEAAANAQSSVGCEYYAARPSAHFANSGRNYDLNCYAVLIANTWETPIEIEVDYDGRQLASSYFRIPRGRGKDIQYELLPEGKLPPNELAILFLSMHSKPPYGVDVYAPCPESVGAAVVGQTEVRGSGYGKMFHIRTSAPVIAYDAYPYGGAASQIPSSSLLLPTSAWGTDNLVMDGYAVDAQHIDEGTYPYFQILAREDDTRVKIRPTATLSSAGGAPPIAVGTTGEITLQRGEFVQFAQPQEINGTAIESDKPVSIVGGNTCVNIPNAMSACDTIHQQLPPIRLLGDTYVATRYPDREGAVEPEQTPWRILAAASGTTLTYDPPIPGAPTTLERGQWAEFSAAGPFVVRSQDADHPIYVASYMTAGSAFPTRAGDPEMVNVVPVGQYLSSYVFLTDPAYGNTSLVFVREPVNGTYEDVELDCVGPVRGWEKVGNSGYEVAHVNLVKRGFPQGDCDNGVHRATSKRPFALTVWGWDVFASYGYPAGIGTKVLNDVPALR